MEGTSDKKFCEVCGKEVASSNWAKHIKTKKHSSSTSSAKVYRCPEGCGYVGLSRQALYSHKQRLHTDGGSDEVVYYQYCEVCDVALQSEAAAHKHRSSKKHHRKIFETRPDLAHPTLAGRVMAKFHKMVVKEKLSTHVRGGHYKPRKEPKYEDYMAEDFQANCKDEADYDVIIRRLVKFSGKKGWDLESEMDFETKWARYNCGEMDDDDKIGFVTKIACAMYELDHKETFVLVSEDFEYSPESKKKLGGKKKKNDAK